MDTVYGNADLYVKFCFDANATCDIGEEDFVLIKTDTLDKQEISLDSGDILWYSEQEYDDDIIHITHDSSKCHPYNEGLTNVCLYKVFVRGNTKISEKSVYHISV